MSEELNKTAVKPSRRKRRWQVKSFFLLFFTLFLHSKHPLLHYRLGAISSEQSGSAGGGVGGEGRGGGDLSGWWYYQRER